MMMTMMIFSLCRSMLLYMQIDATDTTNILTLRQCVLLLLLHTHHKTDHI